MLTNQQIFNKVSKHLLKQNKQSSENQQCKYKMIINSETLKCAVGCLIPEKLYISSIEGNSIATASHQLLVILHKSKIDIINSKELLMELQNIYDYESPCSWKLKLKNIADKFSLTFKD